MTSSRYTGWLGVLAFNQRHWKFCNIIISIEFLYLSLFPQKIPFASEIRQDMEISTKVAEALVLYHI